MCVHGHSNFVSYSMNTGSANDDMLMALHTLDNELLILEKANKAKLDREMVEAMASVSFVTPTGPLPSQSNASLAIHAAVVSEMEKAETKRSTGRGGKQDFISSKMARRKQRKIKKHGDYTEKLNVKQMGRYKKAQAKLAAKNK